METIKMSVYDGRELIDSYPMDFDDNIARTIDWFVGAVQDEGGNRVRITHLDENGRVLRKWGSKVDPYFEQFMDNLKEELAEERLVSELERE